MQVKLQAKNANDWLAYQPHITITPGLRGGKPHLVGHRITVADVAFWYLEERRAIGEIVADYQLTHALVHAALAYYYDHKMEIDTREQRELAEVELIKVQYPSKLSQKLGSGD